MTGRWRIKKPKISSDNTRDRLPHSGNRSLCVSVKIFAASSAAAILLLCFSDSDSAPALSPAVIQLLRAGSHLEKQKANNALLRGFGDIRISLCPDFCVFSATDLLQQSRRVQYREGRTGGCRGRRSSEGQRRVHF